MTDASAVTLIALANFPLVEPKDDLLELILSSLQTTSYHGACLSLQQGDVLVLAQKIVSKTENRYRYLHQVQPSRRAMMLARQVNKDPRLVELILSESQEVIRQCPGVVIVEHKNGYIHANAGIDQSNIECDDDNPRVLLLPADPDASARFLYQQIQQRMGITVPVIINDSTGRAWRNGTTGMAIGTAGFEPLQNLIGQLDLFDRPLQVTQVAVADELAAAASFVMGQGAEASPVVVIRGAQLTTSAVGSESLLRAKALDLFR